ncbi:hypothetical protein GUITHDRAFT_154682 [Guillardia theta CCMP2712]|uniref:Uncharacterized protein n=1 Tax=Guillardia theta (strain CCMP2712) TaxID=905079 RepID=L1IQJ7_GUITC|nr:hypothetical protein GUITHDRAFT_154682 [Guillardia theta CCMP2712]EKX38528.1 hypothetical protein GUITHDRAFT_154682 [Guillardia theta CCMP2712]|mmetsp:Transcript_11736/g.40555  ORF Transcript_11736/g.40555 Transcript_11736/m.40555 type:complete len:104 (-) Transcript_11736:474-785(-)|eukprot:XP_005825508.1 hypothetical protein GUITHDRAFT_154682 [Guillardia theta CCMP2712]
MGNQHAKHDNFSYPADNKTLFDPNIADSYPCSPTGSANMSPAVPLSPVLSSYSMPDKETHPATHASRRRPKNLSVEIPDCVLNLRDPRSPSAPRTPLPLSDSD